MRLDLAAGIAAVSAFVGGLLYASCQHHTSVSITFHKTVVVPPRHVVAPIDTVTDTKVEVGTPILQGDYDRDALVSRVEAVSTDLLACGDHAHLDGTVTVYFAIRASGETAYADADATDLDAAQCLAKVFDDLVFPPPDSGEVVTASVPLTFSP